MATSSNTDIAVIGMSGRFPGARNIGEYWRNLRNGVESVTFLSEEDLRDADIAADVIHDPDYVRAAYLLDDADRFDASFFSYAPREARFMDPQQRVLLECAWNAMEHAGYAGETKRVTGVYVGCSLNTYLLFTGVAEAFKTEPVLTLMSNDKDFLATRIGYKLNLEGPCVTVQTACSTSLVAVHTACQSILAGECDMALAGGVCVKVPLKAGYMYREGGMLSRDGHCRAFDAAASGTIFGSGAGIVVLKRYADAVEDGDTIHAVIKATAINNDGGRKASYTAPSVTGLADVISQCMDFAQIDADDIGYIECHGTGTALGDPIEVHALTKAFRASTTRDNYCALASVKSNIGHLESASGIAGLIKAICCLKERYLPQTLHFREANPALGLNGSPFYVNATGQNWVQTDGTARTAAVNSLGVGGTNANVIVQEARPRHAVASRRQWHMIPVSAKTAAKAQVLKTNVLEHLQDHKGVVIADAAYTLATGRKHFDARDVVLLDEEGAVSEANVTVTSALRTPKVVFVLGSEPDERYAAELCAQEPSVTSGDRQGLIDWWRRCGIEPAAVVAPDAEGNARSLCSDILDQYPNSILLPIGFASELTAVFAELLGEKGRHLLIAPLHPDTRDAALDLLQQGAAVWKLGAPFQMTVLYDGEKRSRVPMPTTPLTGERHWWPAPAPAAVAVRPITSLEDRNGNTYYPTGSLAMV